MPGEPFLVCGIEDGVGAGRALGLVHREVGASKEVRRVVTVLGVQGDPHARRDLDRLVAEKERRVTRLLDLPRDRLGGHEVAGALRQDGELVPPEPGNDVGLAKHGFSDGIPTSFRSASPWS